MMDVASANARRPLTLGAVADRLRTPLRLRFATGGFLLAVWFVAAHMPTADEIGATADRLAREEKRLALAKEVEAVRARAATYRERVPAKSDPNEYFQYVLGGVRLLPALKLNALAPEKPKELGPFQALSFKVELEGKFHDLTAFLSWVEDNPRLMRVDQILIQPEQARKADPGRAGLLKMQLTVLGLAEPAKDGGATK